ncbi:hypothetical protein HK102_002288 [Quaeritorhiza haematococci]|nr:hypothetical protein HK102_002288 [Quaeritorhiza haematococci]
MTPSLFMRFNLEQRNEILGGKVGFVTDIVLGGEPFPTSLLSPAEESSSRHVRLWNIYGTTECSVWATLHLVTELAPSQEHRFAPNRLLTDGALETHSFRDADLRSRVVPLGEPFCGTDLEIREVSAHVVSNSAVWATNGSHNISSAATTPTSANEMSLRRLIDVGKEGFAHVRAHKAGTPCERLERSGCADAVTFWRLSFQVTSPSRVNEMFSETSVGTELCGTVDELRDSDNGRNLTIEIVGQLWIGGVNRKCIVGDEMEAEMYAYNFFLFGFLHRHFRVSNHGSCSHHPPKNVLLLLQTACGQQEMWSGYFYVHPNTFQADGHQLRPPLTLLDLMFQRTTLNSKLEICIFSEERKERISNALEATVSILARLLVSWKIMRRVSIDETHKQTAVDGGMRIRDENHAEYARDEKLLAFVVLADDRTAIPGETDHHYLLFKQIQSVVSSHLPFYSRPDVVVVLDGQDSPRCMPINTNGKASLYLQMRVLSFFLRGFTVDKKTLMDLYISGVLPTFSLTPFEMPPDHMTTSESIPAQSARNENIARTEDQKGKSSDKLCGETIIDILGRFLERKSGPKHNDARMRTGDCLTNAILHNKAADIPTRALEFVSRSTANDDHIHPNTFTSTPASDEPRVFSLSSSSRKLPRKRLRDEKATVSGQSLLSVASPKPQSALASVTVLNRGMHVFAEEVTIKEYLDIMLPTTPSPAPMEARKEDSSPQAYGDDSTKPTRPVRSRFRSVSPPPQQRVLDQGGGLPSPSRGPEAVDESRKLPVDATGGGSATSRSSVPPARIVWKVHMEKCVDASPVVRLQQNSQPSSQVAIMRETGKYRTFPNAVAYIGSHSGLFCAIELTFGSIVWSRHLSDRIEAGACIAGKRGDLIVVGCYDGLIHILCAFTGKSLGTFVTNDLGPCRQNDHDETTESQKASPTVKKAKKEHSDDLDCGDIGELSVDGKDDERGHVMKNDSVDLVFKIDLESPVFASPAVDIMRRRIIACTLKGEVFCIVDSHNVSQGTSSEATHQDPGVGRGKPIFSSPRIIESTGNVVFGCVDGNVVCLDGSTGEMFPVSGGQIWAHRSSKEVYATPLAISITDEKEPTEAAAALVLCKDPPSGTTFILCISIDGVIALVDAADGGVVGRSQLPGEVFSSPMAFILKGPIGEGTKESPTSCQDASYQSRLCCIVGCRDDYVYLVDISPDQMDNV